MKKGHLRFLALICAASILCLSGVHTASADSSELDEINVEVTIPMRPAIVYYPIIHCYSVTGAISYAAGWYNSYNTDYGYYNGDGGDCANFVSQCLYAGGLKKTTAAQTTYAWDPDATDHSLWTSS